MTKISKTKHITKKGVVKTNPVPKTISTMDGTAYFVRTEVEDKYGRWNDNYYIRDGYYVIHNGKKHHVYSIKKPKEEKERPQWFGTVPKQDDFGVVIGSEFVDGKTKMGPWATMSMKSFRTYGVGLGTGKGQRYKKEGNTWYKMEG